MAPFLRNILGVDLKQDYTPGIEIVLGPKLRIETIKVSIGIQKTDAYASTVSCVGSKLDYNLFKGGVDNIYGTQSRQSGSGRRGRQGRRDATRGGRSTRERGRRAGESGKQG